MATLERGQQDTNATVDEIIERLNKSGGLALVTDDFECERHGVHCLDLKMTITIHLTRQLDAEEQVNRQLEELVYHIREACLSAGF